MSQRLGHHPDRVLLPGVEISSGSLGHGLPMAVGAGASGCAADRRRRDARVFCLVGDAELDEGSNHEAIALAGRLGLDRLAVVGGGQRLVDGMAGRAGLRRASSSRAGQQMTVDGRDHEALSAALHA